MDRQKLVDMGEKLRETEKRVMLAISARVRELQKDEKLRAQMEKEIKGEIDSG